ncbi:MULTISPECIES: hypothetical protein [unclassified Streptomyces]|uniref:hypothetical protein n=1 Tax=unclassified Streptomyces TaxID=2593676 RepID=UPI00214B5C77|nr:MULTISPECIES: hypothetical protein [unclassified Streptomyces]
MPSDSAPRVVREAARRIVDLVLTEDDVYLDSLPDEVETSIAVPLTEVARMLEDPTGDKELRGGVRLLLEAGAEVAPRMPGELRHLFEELRFAMRGVTAR